MSWKVRARPSIRLSPAISLRTTAVYPAFQSILPCFLNSSNSIIVVLAMRTWCSIDTICWFFIKKRRITTIVHSNLTIWLFGWCGIDVDLHIQSFLTRGTCSVSSELCSFDLPFPHVLFFTHLSRFLQHFRWEVAKLAICSFSIFLFIVLSVW